VKKKNEYRVHVFKDAVIDVQQKRKRREADVDYRVRNHEGGWVFCRENVDCPADVTREALKAVHALGLNFGAVDVGWNEHYEEACVYEVNSAPGLEGTTLLIYADCIADMMGGTRA
jgi:glutathione synthase/RimK-type ligase-like ATP-grasp enzyme